MLGQDGGRGSPQQGREDAPETEMVDATYVQIQGQVQPPGWAPDTYSSYLSHNPYGSYFETFESLGVNGLDDFAFRQPAPPLTPLEMPDDNDADLGDPLQDLLHSTYDEQFAFESLAKVIDDAPWFSTTPRTQESGDANGSVEPDKEDTSSPNGEGKNTAASVGDTGSPQPAASPPDDQDTQAANSLLAFGKANVDFGADYEAAKQLQQMSSYGGTITESIEKEDEKEDESIAMRTKKRCHRVPSAKREALEAWLPARKKARKTCQKSGTQPKTPKKKEKKEKIKKIKRIKMSTKRKNRVPMARASSTATSKDRERSTSTVHSAVLRESTPAREGLETNHTRLPSAPIPGAPSRHTIAAPTLPSPALASAHTPISLPLRLRASAESTPTHITSMRNLEDPFSDQNSALISATSPGSMIWSPNDFIFSAFNSIYRAPTGFPGTSSQTANPETTERYHGISPSQARKLRNDQARTRAG